MADETDIVQPSQKKKGVGAALADCGSFIWNKDKSEFLGRTGASWAKIGFFYLVFYAALSGFFACMLAVFFATVDDNHPKYAGYDSLLKDNPGIGFQPMPNHESTLIRFYSGKKGSYKIYTDYLQAFLLQYENEFQRPGDTSNIVTCNKQSGGKIGDQKNSVCKFELLALDPCIAKQEFGYDKGEPCVLLKMNRVYGWKPSVSKSTNNSDIQVECHGQNPADIDNIGTLDYYPNDGKFGIFYSYYFPFLSQQNYQSPLVMVKFKNPSPGILIMVECKLHNDNIRYNRALRQGAVKFELIVD
ncbi:sodium/potassium-transporting ATPase subunit beta-2-like [Lineus longissimus]|uniref:sodium/potassium-transporting ATPase subunit beta-2-like n=1 Tax=Lineus longissimus TaxID=88925 RepID=UPI002B4DEC8D